MKKSGIILGTIAVIVGIAAIVLLVARPWERAERPMEAELTVLHVSNRVGNMEPCGCQMNPFGGMDREANAVKQIRAERPNVLYVDSGNFLADKELKGSLEHHREKAIALVEMANRAGLEAFAPGPNDYRLGVELLKEAEDAADFPFLSSNVKADGEPVFEESLIVEKSGVRIALLSASDPEAVTGAPVAVEPPTEMLARLLPKARAEADVVVLLSQLGPRKERELVESVPGIDIIVGASPNYGVHEAAWFNGGRTILVDTENQGYMLGRLDVTLQFPLKGFNSESEMAKNAQELAKLEAAANGKHPALLENFRKMKQLEPIVGGSPYTSELIKLDVERFGAPNEITEMMEKYREAVRQRALSE